MNTKIEKLSEVFKTMTYGENLEDTSEASKWLETVEIVDKTNNIKNILENLKTDIYTPQKAHFIRWAQELEKNCSLICQIEILSRGVLSKDTKKAVEKLAQYFYYYASFSSGDENILKDKVVGVFDDDQPLWLLGLFLGPALAIGYTVLLQTGTKFATVVTYILEFGVKAGIHKDAVYLVPSNEDNAQTYFDSRDIQVLTLFVEAANLKYWKTPPRDLKLLICYKTPMLVFNDADLDSAVESVIEAAWGYQGMLPWSINTIIVQENIFDKFTDKLKNKVKSIRIGSGNDKLADISYPSNPKIFQNLMRTVDKANALGIEIFQKDFPAKSQDGARDCAACRAPCSAGAADLLHMEGAVPGLFTPTLIIGFKVDTNNVLTFPEKDGTVTLLPFRSIDEAVNLANNTRQGLGASVWSENIGLVNEVARKLNVGNVWINEFGLFSPDLPLVSFKDSGVGYFGGKHGLLEYTIVPNPSYTKIDRDQPITSDTVNKAITSSKAASASWGQNSALNRMKVFLELSDFIERNKNKFSGKLSEETLNNFKLCLESVVSESLQLGSSTQYGCSVMSLKYPKGVLVIGMSESLTDPRVKLLVAALFEGNVVILLNKAPDAQDFFQELSQKLPSGVLTVLTYSDNVLEAALSNKEVNAVYNLDQFIEDFSWQEIFNLVTMFKNIWSNIGQSSQCNL